MRLTRSNELPCPTSTKPASTVTVTNQASVSTVTVTNQGSTVTKPVSTVTVTATATTEKDNSNKYFDCDCDGNSDGHYRIRFHRRLREDNRENVLNYYDEFDNDSTTKTVPTTKTVATTKTVPTTTIVPTTTTRIVVSSIPYTTTAIDSYGSNDDQCNKYHCVILYQHKHRCSPNLYNYHEYHYNKCSIYRDFKYHLVHTNHNRQPSDDYVELHLNIHDQFHCNGYDFSNSYLYDSQPDYHDHDAARNHKRCDLSAHTSSCHYNRHWGIGNRDKHCDLDRTIRYYNLNPNAFGLDYTIFVNKIVTVYVFGPKGNKYLTTYTTGDYASKTLLDHYPPAASTSATIRPAKRDTIVVRQLLKRDDTIVPAVCFAQCNNVYIEAQKVGKSPALCAPDSAFQSDYSSCQQCVVDNGDTTKVTLQTYVVPQFEPFINFCRETTAQSAVLPSVSTQTVLPVAPTQIAVVSIPTPPAVTTQAPVNTNTLPVPIATLGPFLNTTSSSSRASSSSSAASSTVSTESESSTESSTESSAASSTTVSSSTTTPVATLPTTSDSSVAPPSTSAPDTTGTPTTTGPPVLITGTNASPQTAPSLILLASIALLSLLSLLL
ncbi:hypothetical protein M7I_6910 [Glarea lozoyensis 74030]|uniref:Uncharacterized protein n=1 Tax=Glarea lozoyensis (strain ATCC 74030 / MF5533) TaxID=1104152 RepID=H0EVV3_GLAL7|nr:hypothetical protein M7I_6910 [Glarea lozoyensis 74030]